MKHVLVLGGGDSPEREVSLRSAAAVARGLEAAGHCVGRHDPSGPGWEERLEAAAREYDTVFPILHGKGGEDGAVQCVLEAAGVRYLGSDSETSALCIDKARTRERLISAGIRMPLGTVCDVHEAQWFIRNHRRFVAKPINGGSSIDTVIARDGLAESVEVLNDVFRRYGRLLLEELIEGQELTVPVLGEEALPPILIIPPAQGEFDYDNKYNGRTQEVCPVPQELVGARYLEAAMELAEDVHHLLGARHLSRTDMMLTPEGELVVLELNTMPGMTDQSLFPKSAATVGYDMPRLTDTFVSMTLGVDDGAA